jgi:methenyltetrahydromethanopterin cyclohydrolase
MQMHLNARGLARAQPLIDDPSRYNVAISRETGCRIIDCGVDAPGGLEAGRALAEVCLAGLGQIELVLGSSWPGPAVRASTDQPTSACIASQYAGWPVARDSYFGMGSGPMRAARGREPVFDHVGHLERPDEVIGVLESGKLPDSETSRAMAEECHVDHERLTLLVARTASLAGTIQVVARSIETALHKMHELEFDITRVISGFGVAPLPPAAADDLTAIGRTNDAVLYGGEVTLWVEGDDDSLIELGPQIPSSSSPDSGRPFSEIFERYERDFYKIDPLLFSPAVITLINTGSGRSFQFGAISTDVLRKSFSGD